MKLRQHKSSMLNNIKGVIFDLDGTIADSMWVWEQIDDEFLNISLLSIASYASRDGGA